MISIILSFDSSSTSSNSSLFILLINRNDILITFNDADI